ncbi:MAG: matrixin family metalloprotease [Fimbriimonas sp.]
MPNSLPKSLEHCRRMALILGFAVAGFVALGSAAAGMQPPLSPSGIDSTSVVLAPAVDRQFPLKWRMGAVDPRFGLDASEVKQAVEQAIRLWESAAGKRLFVYDRSSGFPVNLVYDSRHAGRVAARQAKERLDGMKSDIGSAKDAVQSAQDNYKLKLSLFEVSQSAYRRKLEDYNRDVEYWNRNGGAPASVVSRLNAERQNLEIDRSRLRKEEQEVDSLRTDVNDKIDTYNSLLSRYNSAANSFNRTFGKAVEMSVGETAIRGSKVGRINIFSFESNTHLAVILAHELGHALGLKHVKGQDSIMVAVEEGESASRFLLLSAADRAELQTRVLSKFRSKKN